MQIMQGSVGTDGDGTWVSDVIGSYIKATDI